MPVNRQDVEMLLGSMRGMGESFAQQSQREAENELKQKALAAEMERYKKATEHETRMETKQDETNALMRRKTDDQEDHQLLQDMITVNPFLTPDSRKDANSYLMAHPKFGAVGIQLAEPEKKPVPQPGQSSRVMELQKAREFRDKASALGPEGDLDLQKWYINAAEDLENGPQAPEKVVTKDEPLEPGAPVTTKTTTQPTRTFGRLRFGNPTPLAPPANGLQDELNQARQAILKGANPEAVKQRYKQHTGMDFPQ